VTGSFIHALKRSKSHLESTKGRGMALGILHHCSIQESKRVLVIVSAAKRSTNLDARVLT
jgi:hypothetical protein